MCYLFFIFLIGSSVSSGALKSESKVDKLILNIVYSVISPENLAECTVLRITGDDSVGDTFSSFEELEQSSFYARINPHIQIHFSNNQSKNQNLTNLPMMKSQFLESCTFAWYFLQPNQWKYFNTNFMHSIPGGIFGSYHLTFTRTSSNDYFKRNVPLIMVQMHNLIVIKNDERTTTSFEIFTPNIWFNDSISLARYQRGWYEENLKIFRTKWMNYGDGPLIVATTPDTTPAELDEFLRTKKIKKYIAASSVEFTRYLNTTCRILPVRPGVYGSKDKNGKWYGILAEVWKGNAHFSCPMGISSERTEIGAYSNLYAFDHVIFITGLPKQAKQSGSLEYLASPFHWKVWVAMIVTFYVIYGLLLLKRKVEISKAPPIKQSNTRYFALTILNVLLRPTLDQSGDTPNLIKRVLKDTMSRFVFAYWLLSLNFLSSGYKSKVISALQKPYIVMPPRTFEELAHSKYKLGAMLYNESFFGESFRQLNNDIGREVRSRVHGFTNIAGPECYLLTERTEHACIGTGEFLRSVANVFLTDDRGQLLYKVSTDGLFSFGVGTTVSKNFPHLRAPLTRLVERLEQQGVVDYWTREEKYWGQIKGQRLSHKFRTKRRHEQNTTKGDSRVWQLLIIIIFGHSCAFAVLLSEILFKGIQNYLKRRFSLVIIIR